MGTPAAEIEIDVRQARQLLAAQHPDLADLPMVPIASGWDNHLLRLERLAVFFEALHGPVPADAPCNPYRGMPLSERADAFAERLAKLHGKTDILDRRVDALWSDALAAPNDTTPTWIHGDLHPRNVLIEKGCLTGVIDWGDLASSTRLGPAICRDSLKLRIGRRCAHGCHRRAHDCQALRRAVRYHSLVTQRQDNK